MKELLEEIREHTDALKRLNQELYEIEVNNLMMVRSETIEDYIWTMEQELRELEEEWEEEHL
jgi:hypothetical protein